MNNQIKNKASPAGIICQLVIILARFSQGYVHGTIFIPDDRQGLENKILKDTGIKN